MNILASVLFATYENHVTVKFKDAKRVNKAPFLSVYV
jgi:hypothetical protein